MSTEALGVAIGVGTFCILTIALGVSALDAHFAAKLTDALRQTNEQLSALALRDGLTGLPNRMLLDDRFGEAVTRAARDRPGFAIPFVDLDRFNPFNATYVSRVGHPLPQPAPPTLHAGGRATA